MQDEEEHSTNRLQELLIQVWQMRQALAHCSDVMYMTQALCG
jgi:hypothetical protein